MYGEKMISVIIPLYNVENYILDCLLSFEKQTYSNFELIIVNDGSTDKSRSIVEDYLGKSNMTIKLINQKNAGVSSARNTGLSRAIGEYVCFVDSDDLVVSGYLETMIRDLKSTNSDLVICGIKSVPDNNEIVDIMVTNKNLLVMDYKEALNSYLYKEIICGMGSFLVKKEILSKNKITFSESYRYSEDQEMIWKMINHSDRMVYNEIELYLYRTRPESAMSIVDDKRLDGLELMMNLEEYFKEQNPTFYKEYKKYGVARWVWATTWQAALGCENYKSFADFTEKLHSVTYFKSLLSYPDKKVKLSSALFVISPIVYYFFMKLVVSRVFNLRSINEQ